MNRPFPSTLSVRVPFAVRQRGGRKQVIIPAGTSGYPRPRIDTALVKAIARAHRWQRMLERGEYATLKEFAAAEKINLSYMSRILRLTLLAPEIVEAILDGLQPERMTLARLVKAFPLEWEEQRRFFGTIG